MSESLRQRLNPKISSAGRAARLGQMFRDSGGAPEPPWSHCLGVSHPLLWPKSTPHCHHRLTKGPNRVPGARALNSPNPGLGPALGRGQRRGTLGPGFVPTHTLNSRATLKKSLSPLSLGLLLCKNGRSSIRFKRLSGMRRLMSLQVRQQPQSLPVSLRQTDRQTGRQTKGLRPTRRGSRSPAILCQ